MILRDVRKSYGSNPVLRGIDLTFEPGRVHALLGPNGAGKSTLLGCLSGAVQPDSGSIEIDGGSHAGFSPQGAFEAGTAIIYQHFQLTEDLSVVDNMFLGGEIVGRLGQVRLRQEVAEATRVLREVGADFAATTLVRSLSVGQRQLVEIAKALRHRPRLLILDEPTAALSAHETEVLLALVQRLARESGLAVVYVTHLLREVLAVSDEVSVLRDGRVLWTRPTAELDLPDLVAAVSVSPLTLETEERGDGRPRTTTRGRVLVEIADFAAAGAPAVDLELEEGEVVGVFGLLGSGRTNLVEALAGARPARGTLRIDGTAVGQRSPATARRGGVVLVAADRAAQSLFGTMSARENVLMPHYRRLAAVVRRRGRENRAFDEVARRMGLRPHAPTLEAERFSGGNAQKLVMGRWLGDGSRVRLLLLDEPTQGVDVGARHELHAMIRAFAREPGRAVLFVSSDPDEIAALADRVVVLVESQISETLPADVSERELLAAAQGR